ncbi:MAG TPA: acyl-CoA thioesterase domain-containing protein, partial [Acidimicrobiales bacterium]|nr:acyl-CoA thioesterase domain-containing protein [Acidimicrobiales bacterium]
MGDIEAQTAVEPAGDGRFTAMVHPDWEIWGPCGGYVAALALRAAGAASPLVRPASFFCHYLSVASFAPVDLEVTALRAGRTVLAQRVGMSQEGRPVLEAMVWSVGEVEGLEHEDVDPPDVPDPDGLPTFGELRPDETRAAMRFWENFDQRPI